VGKEKERELQAAAPQDLRELLPHLQKRGEELTAKSEKLLLQRGEQEAKEMRAILERQQEAIAATARKTETDAPMLPFEGDEQRQLDANRRHWDSRLEAIEKELDEEPKRVREVYAVKATRVEPVGLVYLLPVTG
jgi:hypothetical protein